MNEIKLVNYDYQWSMFCAIYIFSNFILHNKWGFII